MSSQVSWGTRPSKKTQGPPTAKSALDSFVSPEQNKATKRLNLNIPTSLHARIKAKCAFAGRDMTEALIEILEQHFSDATQILK